MINREYLAYKGRKFTIEWYFNAKGKSQSLYYFEGLEKKQQVRFMALVKYLAEEGTIFNKEKFRHEGDKIYAFKIKPDRFLCFFFKKKKVIITNAFEKKQQRLPKREKDKALTIMNDYINRTNGGNYYD